MHVCRFYKLFLDYLEERFQQSEEESIKELVGQFQGEYAYTTVCQACKTVSQRKCQFSELELNLKVNSLRRRWHGTVSNGSSRTHFFFLRSVSTWPGLCCNLVIGRENH
jgi:hypothetical protein